jgi:hypothetical protein
MTVIETTNAVLNYDISLVHPRSVPSFVRALVANAQAAGGREWTEIFARENSGTVLTPTVGSRVVCFPYPAHVVQQPVDDRRLLSLCASCPPA